MQVLNLSSNQIHSLTGLSNHRYLQDINMEDNEVRAGQKYRNYHIRECFQ